MTHLSTKHLLGIKDLTVHDVELIIETSRFFKEVINRPIKKVPSLRDISIANIFFENSTRTKLSFELAEKRLSADVINFSASGSSTKKGETLLDTVNNILAMKIDMVVMRHSSCGAPHFLAKNIGASVINAGDGTHEHPTQALLDFFSIYQLLGNQKKLKIALLGDIKHSRVALSNILLFKKMGMDVKLSGPNTLVPAEWAKLNVQIEPNPAKALAWADVGIVLRIQLERHQIQFFPSLREYQNFFGITYEMISKLNNKPIIMHPGPINRGIELDSKTIDEYSNSIILNQVENGVATRMSILYLLANNGQ